MKTNSPSIESGFCLGVFSNARWSLGALVVVCQMACSQPAGGGGASKEANGAPSGSNSNPQGNSSTSGTANSGATTPFLEGLPGNCPANAKPPASGNNCTAVCQDCACTTIKYTCDRSCYNSSTCQINAGSNGTPSTSVESLGGGCTSLTCVPEDDLSKNLSCTASHCNPPPVVAPPPTPTGICQAGMECKPGSIRYCDDPASVWTLSTCGQDGHWGTCVPISVPAKAAGVGDCSDTDYSPELCCAAIPGCCQDNPGGPWVDFGSGQCDAIKCP